MKKYEYAYVDFNDDKDLITQMQVHGQAGWKIVMVVGTNKLLVEKESDDNMRGNNDPMPAPPGRLSADDPQPDWWKIRPSERSHQVLVKELDPNEWVFTREGVEQIIKDRGLHG